MALQDSKPLHDGTTFSKLDEDITKASKLLRKVKRTYVQGVCFWIMLAGWGSYATTSNILQGKWLFAALDGAVLVIGSLLYRDTTATGSRLIKKCEDMKMWLQRIKIEREAITHPN